MSAIHYQNIGVYNVRLTPIFFILAFCAQNGFLHEANDQKVIYQRCPPTISLSHAILIKKCTIKYPVKQSILSRGQKIQLQILQKSY